MAHLRIAFATTLLLFSLSASACLHFGKEFLGKVDEGTQQAFLFHDGTLAHLVVKTDIHAKEGKLPKQLSWVIPFPAMPKKYEEVDNRLFSELTGLVSLERSASWGKGAPRSAILVHEMKEVGQYKIQEIEILDEKGGKELNAWLADHKYNEMPLERQKPYLKKGAVFLAITVTLDEKEMSFKPLHIAYPATDLSFPVRFSHDSRVFDVNLFVFTSHVLNKDSGNLPYWKFVASDRYDSAVTAKNAYPELKKLLGDKTGYLARFEARHLNTEGRLLKDLAADPTFKP